MNRLRDATSPYLRQHKDNPVSWWEWGDDAFATARERDVPVFLSIGYAACHWCHVMAHESFEDPGVAAYLDEHFVSVKVDREERPDVDAVYMQATQAMTGQGGWPMSCFLTPDGKPFFCGTYFPPEPRHGMPSFRLLLEAVTAAWRDRRDELVTASNSILEQLESHQRVAGESAPDAEALDQAVHVLAREFDPVHAGFGGAPKFPPSMVLEFLLRHHARTGSEPAADMARRTLHAMARGGMYDQLGGGFARYAVDAAWVVPHFEKMLYDNALLLRVYAHAWRLDGDPVAERVVRDSAEFLLRDLRTAEGGFASALDADTPVDGVGVEGATYVWTPAQLLDVLGPDDGPWAAELLSVTTEGTFEHGASTLQLLAEPDDADRWSRVRATLLGARARRAQPARDDKVVAAWNGLAIAALAEAGALLDVPEWVETAVVAADLLVAVHLTGGGLLRVSRDGRAGAPAGVLEDYADVAEGFLALLSVTGDPVWLELAGALLEEVLVRFTDGVGTFFDTASDGEPLVLRPQDPTDNATPSGRSAAAGALLTYAAHTGSGRHREAAERALWPAGALASRAPRFAGWALAVAEALVTGPLQVGIVGAPDDPGRAALWRVARASSLPGLAVVAGSPDTAASDGLPLLRDRPLLDGHAAAYVCRDFVCDAPTSDPAHLAQLLGVAPHTLVRP